MDLLVSRLDSRVLRFVLSARDPLADATDVLVVLWVPLPAANSRGPPVSWTNYHVLPSLAFMAWLFKSQVLREEVFRL